MCEEAILLINFVYEIDVAYFINVCIILFVYLFRYCEQIQI